MREHIRAEVAAITPLDSIERDTIADVVSWIDSGAPLCRVVKPATPDKHLVSYFVVIDGDHLLLVDHINAQKWLPTGGHVEPGEHPRTTVERESMEELGLTADFISVAPVLVTSTVTVGLTAGHTDVSLWYAIAGDRAVHLSIDPEEFHGLRWFHREALPENTDPHLGRFVAKFYREQVAD